MPMAGILFREDPSVSQLLLADALGHVGRIWDHLVGWALQNGKSGPILERREGMSNGFGEWKSRDPLTDLPPPP